MVQDKGKTVKKTSSAQNVKRWGENIPHNHMWPGPFADMLPSNNSKTSPGRYSSHVVGITSFVNPN